MVDASRLADELRAEQDHCSAQAKAKRALEAQVRHLHCNELLNCTALHCTALHCTAATFYNPAFSKTI